MNRQLRWFVEALRDACNHALEDGMVGDQLGHIETIEVTDAGSPMMLKVTCFGAYSPTECRRVYENHSIIEVADMVARHLADRSVGLKDTFNELINSESTSFRRDVGFNRITGERY